MTSVDSSLSLSVALATTATELGGTWRHIEDLGRELQRRDFQVIISSPAANAALRKAIAAAGLDWLPLAASVRRRDIDVWHVHLPNTYDRSVLALLAARRIWGPVVVTEHLPRTDASDAGLGSVDERRTRGAATAKTAFKRAQFSLVARIITVGVGAARFLEARYRLAPGRVNVVFNGVPPEEWIPPRAPRTPLEVVAVGSVIRQKGFDVLVNAASLSSKWNVTFYGDGPHLRSLQTKAASLCAGRLTFAGRVEDPILRIRDADVVCIPSRWESSSYVALEAGAVGRPVIASNVDGVNEIVVSNLTGQLVRPNDPTQLAAALDAAAESSGELRRWGYEAHRRITTMFTLERMVDQTIAVYRSALSGSGSHGKATR
jgi:glycosyltransferase involved in cell wall biosynthesis